MLQNVNMLLQNFSKIGVDSRLWPNFEKCPTFNLLVKKLFRLQEFVKKQRRKSEIVSMVGSVSKKQLYTVYKWFQISASQFEIGPEASNLTSETQCT
jgi:hypothetical protein